jgi:hypothetical protein
MTATAPRRSSCVPRNRGKARAGAVHPRRRWRTVRHSPSWHGGTSYDWLSGPNKGYGFGSSGKPNRSMEEHRESTRAFLAMIDPNTGYIGDD